MTWRAGEGGGPTTVLVHGFGDAGAGWARVAQMLAEDGPVLIVDSATLLPETREGVRENNLVVMGEHAPALPGVLLDGLVEMNRALHLRPLFEANRCRSTRQRPPTVC